MFRLLVLAAGVIALQAAATDSPFFCNLKALTAAERTEHQALGARIAAAVSAIRELPDGYAFELEGQGLAFHELATWVAFERRCCPFFDFALEWRREGGPMTVKLTGRDGVKAFIRAEFGGAFPAAR